MASVDATLAVTTLAMSNVALCTQSEPIIAAVLIAYAIDDTKDLQRVSAAAI